MKTQTLWTLSKVLILTAIVLGAIPVLSVERIVMGGDEGRPWRDGGGEIAPVVIVGKHRVSNSNVPGNVVDFASRQGWTIPKKADITENIAIGLEARGGSVTAPSVLADLSTELVKMVDNDPTTAFRRKSTPGRPAPALGVILQFDLGARFGVGRLRFFPRNAAADFAAPAFPFQDDYLRAYEILVNDGSRETQVAELPVFTSIVLRPQNDAAVADVAIEAQYVRYVQIKSLSNVGFEVAELQVFGEGFVPKADYQSNIFDMGDELAIWGKVRWQEFSEGDSIRSSVRLRTRSGDDPTPVVFRRIRPSDAEHVPWKVPADLEGDAERQLVNLLEDSEVSASEARAQYWTLSNRERQAISLDQTDWEELSPAERGALSNDLINWSPWSAPYRPEGRVTSQHVAAGEGGVRITSPAPRRYFQFRLEYISEEVFSAKGVGSLSFDYTTPPLAEQIVAEIIPRKVELGQVTPFTLMVVPRLRNGVDHGFDALVVHTLVRVNDVERVTMNLGDGTRVEDNFVGVDFTRLPVIGNNFVISAVEDRSFQIDLPLVQASTGEQSIEIEFKGRILRTGSEFPVEARLRDANEVSQRAVAGNAVSLSRGAREVRLDVSRLVVQGDRRRLLANVEADPPVLTPNGDGINDVTTIHFDITELTGSTDVNVRIYDLMGRMIRILESGTGTSGEYARDWDGMDGLGFPVPPGIYLFRIDIKADAGPTAGIGTIAVAR